MRNFGRVNQLKLVYRHAKKISRCNQINSSLLTIIPHQDDFLLEPDQKPARKSSIYHGVQ